MSSVPFLSLKNTKTVELKDFLDYSILNRQGILMTTDALTTEKLKKKFKNNFDLCNFAIRLGREEIMNNTQASLKYVIDQVDKRASECGV